MKTLLVLRHAKSSWDDRSLEDHERPLNARGRGDAPRIGNLVRKQALTPDVIISSDAVRARSTADAVCAASQCAREVILDRRLYLASPSNIVSVLKAIQTPDAKVVMIVGHNPGLEELVTRLTGAPQELPTAALAQISLPIDRWRDLQVSTRGTLVALWRPKDL